MPPYDPLFSPPRPLPGRETIDAIRLRMKRWYGRIRICIAGIVLSIAATFVWTLMEMSRSFARVAKDGKVDQQSMELDLSSLLAVNAVATAIAAISTAGLIVCLCYFIRDSLRLSKAVGETTRNGGDQDK